MLGTSSNTAGPKASSSVATAYGPSQSQGGGGGAATLGSFAAGVDGAPAAAAGAQPGASAALAPSAESSGWLRAGQLAPGQGRSISK